MAAISCLNCGSVKPVCHGKMSKATTPDRNTVPCCSLFRQYKKTLLLFYGLFPTSQFYTMDKQHEELEKSCIVIYCYNAKPMTLRTFYIWSWWLSSVNRISKIGLIYNPLLLISCLFLLFYHNSESREILSGRTATENKWREHMKDTPYKQLPPIERTIDISFFFFILFTFKFNNHYEFFLQSALCSSAARKFSKDLRASCWLYG